MDSTAVNNPPSSEETVPVPPQSVEVPPPVPVSDVTEKKDVTTTGNAPVQGNPQKEKASVVQVDYNEGSSLLPSIINMMNTIIGAGTISLPSTILDGGIIGAGLLLLVSLILSLYGAHYLSASAIYTNEDSYGFIGKKLINKGCGYAADFFMVLFDFGISIGYCNIVFGQTVDLVSSYTSLSWDVVNNNKWVYYLPLVDFSGLL